MLDGANMSDAEVASWADEIRRERRETADWHYVNIPHGAQKFDRARDGRKGENVHRQADRAGEASGKQVAATGDAAGSTQVSGAPRGDITSRCTAPNGTAIAAAMAGSCSIPGAGRR